MEHSFQPYGLPHLAVIFLTIVLPFALAAIVRRTKSPRVERGIVVLLSGVLALNYVGYLIFVRSHGIVSWFRNNTAIAPMKTAFNRSDRPDPSIAGSINRNDPIITGR